MKDYSIETLSSSNYHQALKVALEIFKSDPNAKEWIPNAYQKAVFPERYIGEQNKFAYWVLVDNKTKKIVGVTGLYTKNKDRSFCYWLGWFGIIPEYRRKSIGKYLFDWTLKEVKRRGKTTLRIETSDLMYARAAVNFYLTNDCYSIERKEAKFKKMTYNQIFFEKKLA